MPAAGVKVATADELAVWSQHEAIGRVLAVVVRVGDGPVHILLLQEFCAGVERFKVGLVNGYGGGLPQPLLGDCRRENVADE